MKSDPIRLACSALALFCFVAMFIPVIAPRYPASDYYAQEGNDDFFLVGDYYLAREYWTITDFAAISLPVRIILSLDQAMLLLWAVLSIRGEAGKQGLFIAGFNLVFVGIIIIRMLSMMWSCEWGVLAVTVLIMIASVVMTAKSK